MSIIGLILVLWLAVGWDLVSINMTDPAQPLFYVTSISSYGYSSAYETNIIKQAAAATGYLYLAAGEA